MQPSSILLIDGTEPGDEDLAPIFAVLQDTLAGSGVNLQTLSLTKLKLGHCVGCFGCWLKTPGQCVQRDAGQEIVQNILRSDTTILFSPVVFGMYAPSLKLLLDRCLSCLNLPYLQISHGETHHEPRYENYPRLVGIGVQRKRDFNEARLFKLIVGRNAMQLHSPSYAANVVSTTDSPERLHREFQSLLTRADPLPRSDSLKELLPVLSPSSGRNTLASEERKALLLVGSPKAKPSTSAALGGYLMRRLEEQGWQTETLRLRARLREPEVQAELLAAVEHADLLILASPLYNDSLPYLAAYALELIKSHRAMQTITKPRRLVAIVNNGFPEPHHNLPAIAVCRRFAEVCGLDWAGGLPLGGGEALSGGQPLAEISRILPPVKHMMRALDLAAASLAKGQPIPHKAARLIARNPIFPAPFPGYRWIFQRVAARRWERDAAENGMTPAMLRAQPYLF